MNTVRNAALGPQPNMLTLMKASRRWLLASPTKVPFYIDGTPRSGALDSLADQTRLASYEEAKAALVSHPTWLLGFALGPDGTGGHWQGIDLDKIVANDLADIANLWTRDGCSGLGYVEMSPSGAGLHIIGYGRSFATLGSNGSGIEAYAGNAAWHNSCRRRMYLQVKVDKDDEGGPVSEAFVLRIMKNQDGVPEPDIELMRGQHGLWQIAAKFTGDLAREAQPDHRQTVLRLIEEYSARGKSISTSLAPQATTGVYATLSGDPAWPRSLNKKRTAIVVRDLERAGDLVAESYPRGNRAIGE